MPQLVKVSGPRAGSAPEVYTVTEPGTFDVQSIFARFNGTLASGAFRPVVTIKAQNGTKVARVFPSTTLAAGDSADVTFAPFLRVEIPSAIDLDIVGAAVRRPSASPQVVPSGGGYTFVTFTAEDFDTAGMWTAAAPTRLSCTQAGLYICIGNGSFDTNAVGIRNTVILLNGVTAVAGVQLGAAAVSWSAVAVGLISAVVGDFIELGLHQNSGGNLNTTLCHLSMLGLGQV